MTLSEDKSSLFRGRNGEFSTAQIINVVGFVMLFIALSLALYGYVAYDNHDMTSVIILCGMLGSYSFFMRVNARSVAVRFRDMEARVEMEKMKNDKCPNCGMEMAVGKPQASADSRGGHPNFTPFRQDREDQISTETGVNHGPAARGPYNQGED